jgi:group I intron endonuclease
VPLHALVNLLVERGAMGAIYLVTNTVNGKQYVGKTTTSLARRWQAHKSRGKRNGTSAIHCAILKYGSDNFEIKSLRDDVDIESELNELEIEYINVLGTKAPNGYNLSDGGEGATGHSPSEKTRALLSAAMKQREPRRDFTHSDETKQKIGAKSLGNKHNIGKKRTLEEKAHLSAVQTGRTRSAETRAKMGRSRLGKPLSPEHREKLRQAKLGRKQSAEHIANRFAKKWAKRKAA